MAISQWFVVLSKPRREAEAAEQLSRQNYVVFLPRVQVQRRQRGRWREVVEPMFPRYLFLQATLGDDDLAPVRSTRGVVGLVRFGGQIRPAPDAVVETLQRLCAAKSGVVELPRVLEPGSRVRILEGPFAGHEAELLNTAGESRVRVLLHLLGTVNAVTVPVDLVEAA